jgi:hypothetical protein
VETSLVPRVGAIRDTAGIIKMVVDDDTEEVLGVSMVGNRAGEVIHEAAMQWVSTPKFRITSTYCMSIRQWLKPSRSLLSRATKIRQNSPAARNETAGAATGSFRWFAKARGVGTFFPAKPFR